MHSFQGFTSWLQILDLVPLADSLTKLVGKCTYCSSRVLFSLRIAADVYLQSALTQSVTALQILDLVLLTDIATKMAGKRAY